MKQLPVISAAIPKSDFLFVACSGGIDSMFAAEFLRRTRKIGLAYFNHVTSYADKAEYHVIDYATKNKLPFVRSEIYNTEMLKGSSLEDFWREHRYNFLNNINSPVITGHHLDDAVETWVWSSCHGKPTLPKLNIKNVWRPFLACRKSAMANWLLKNNVSWIEDPSNQDLDFTRNYIRNMALPHLLKVNPGLHTVIQKKIKEMAKSLN